MDQNSTTLSSANSAGLCAQGLAQNIIFLKHFERPAGVQDRSHKYCWPTFASPLEELGRDWKSMPVSCKDHP